MIEFRGDAAFISGVVNTTEKESHFIPSARGRFKEIIKEGAFASALKRAKEVLLLVNHEDDKKLGSTKEGNLKLFESAIGLQMTAEVRDADFIAKARQSGFLHGFSFAFVERAAKWIKGQDGIDRRMISDLDIFEISIIAGSSRPAYPATHVEMRNDSSILERRYTDFEINVQMPQVVDLKQYENTLTYLKLKGMKV